MTAGGEATGGPPSWSSALPPFRQVLRDGGIVAVLTVATFAAEMALSLGLARSMDPANFGSFTVGMVVLTIGMNLAMLGAERSVTRFLPEYLRKGDFASAAGYLRFYAPVALLLALFIALAVELVHADGILAMLLGKGEALPHAFVFALWVVPLFALARLGAGALRGLRLYALSVGPLQIGVPLLTLLAILAANAGHLEVTEGRVFAVLALAYLLTLALHFAVLPREFRQRLRQPGQYRIRNWMALSIPMMLVGLLTAAMHQVDITMLELLHDQHGDVGRYAAASKVGHMLILPLMAVLIFLTPLLGALSGTDREEAGRRRLFLVAMLILLPANLAIAIPALLAPEWVIGLFGPDYAGAESPMILLALAGFLAATLGLAVPFLQYAGQQRVVLWCAGIAVAGNLVANAFLIPLYGTMGAAATSLATYGLYNLAVF